MVSPRRLLEHLRHADARRGDMLRWSLGFLILLTSCNGAAGEPCEFENVAGAAQADRTGTCAVTGFLVNSESLGLILVDDSSLQWRELERAPSVAVIGERDISINECPSSLITVEGDLTRQDGYAFLSGITSASCAESH